VPAEVAAANAALTPTLNTPGFAARAFATGQALWSGSLSAQGDPDEIGSRAVREGDALRRKLGHYLGAMFYFEGEWFWGMDRIRSLEQRLIEEGFGDGTGKIRVPQPTPRDTTGLAASQVELEYFPSLRSPYTAVGHQRVLDLIERSGVTVRLRPVMPMMMRGIPAPRAKQRYIISDAAREARAYQVPFGRIVDPLGEPVKRAFALFAAAERLGKGMPFVTAYLSAAWAEGVDIAKQAGLRQVAESAGLDWSELNSVATGVDWAALLDENLNAMLAAGLWGVPSFRVSGGSIDTPFACWGQDRIWRVENEIADRV
jgi:2-hydroxychromene-2-carboxylate isomerase